MAALSSSSSCIRSRPVSFPYSKTPTTSNSFSLKIVRFNDHHKRSPFRCPAQRVRYVEYMSLPASQYSVLDAERIERVDDNTFKCYVYRLKFFAFEVCLVLLVRVEELPNGCCINLLFCKLEGSPVVVVPNDKFDEYHAIAAIQLLTSDAIIEVSTENPFVFRALPVETIESTGMQNLEQILKLMLPRFMAQLVKDYQAWATGNTSGQPLGTGEI